MESAEGRWSSFGESQLCEDVKTETWPTSDGGTSGSLGLVTSGLLMKTIKEEEPDDKDYICGGTSSSLKHITPVDQQNGEILKKPVKEEEPDDVSLYCEECRTFFINKCEVHGPALFISDTPVPMGVTDRARQTLPPGLEIGESGISDAGLGVFNKGETVPVGAHFGPYEGDLVDKEEAMNSGYSWVIYKSGQSEVYIDAKRERHANWMRYVNCARNDKEHNLVAFQYRGGIHYRCCRPIQSGQELLVWYEEAYAKDVGVTFNHLWNKKSFLNKMPSTLSFSCSLCLFSYTSQIYLHKHIKRFHHGEYTRMVQSGEINYEDLLPESYRNQNSSGSLNMNSSSRPEKEKIYHCSKCGKNFSVQSYFKTHRCQSVKLYHCTQCGKNFTLKGALQQHQYVHIREKPYQCSECGKCVRRQSELYSHQLVHTGDNPYQCSECGKSFRRRISFQAHQRIHAREKVFRCSQCGKGFSKSAHLRDHKRSHPGKKTYHCSQCGKDFTDTKSLQGHELIHAREKSYLCSQCGKGFTCKSSLKQHHHIHTREKPYQCSQCAKCFRTRAHLQTHQLIHTGEKPYQCSECGKSFTRKSTLYHHQYVHTGEKPYQCSQCGKSFSTSGSLTRHQRIHEQINQKKTH